MGFQTILSKGGRGSAAAIVGVTEIL